MTDVESRSKKYVSFHMFETFKPIFNNNIMVQGLWHEASGDIRYEAILAEDENGDQLSYLFPIFDPDSSEFDDYIPPV
tara:strand:- start:2347 stop:2580 length:234 start_codon:yes stop_codon:yes gene_type:complete